MSAHGARDAPTPARADDAGWPRRDRAAQLSSDIDVERTSLSPVGISVRSETPAPAAAPGPAGSDDDNAADVAASGAANAAGYAGSIRAPVPMDVDDPLPAHASVEEALPLLALAQAAAAAPSLPPTPLPALLSPSLAGQGAGASAGAATPAGAPAAAAAARPPATAAPVAAPAGGLSGAGAGAAAPPVPAASAAATARDPPRAAAPPAVDGSQCYCRQIREDKRRPLFPCAVCGCSFHQGCIEALRTWSYAPLFGDDYYHFTCKQCGDGVETMRRLQLSWVDVVHIVLFNLAHTMQARKVSADNRKFFHWKLDICTFIDNNWNLFWLKPRINTWRNSVASCLSTSLRFISGTRHFENEQEAAGLWALDTLRFPSAIDYGRKSRMYAYSIAPNGTLIEDEAAKKDKDKKRKKTDDERAGSPDPADPATPPSTGGGGSVGGPSALTPAAFAAAAAAKAAKAKASATLPLIKTQSLGGSDSGTDAAKRRRPSKPKKKPEEPAKTGQDKPPQPTNTPVEEEIDSATAIMIYPDIENPKTAVVMSSQPTHTAPQVKVSDNGRLVQTDKGYRMSKASHGVWEGHWYFEIKKETAAGHCRVGWSQISGDLQGPCGYDQFSYAFRDQPGALFHKSMQLKDAPEAYHEGFDQGDVIGLSIYFPPQPPPAGPTASSKVAAFMNKAARIAAETVARVVAAGSKDDKDGKDGRDPIDLKNIDIKNIDLKAIDLKNIDLKSIESPTRAAMVEAAASLPLQAITSGRLAVAVDPVLLSRLWDPERMLQYMPFRSKPLATTHGSEIRFFKNGRPLGAAFRDLYQGKYHPAVSLFGGAAVSINFGPKFAFSPPEGAKPFSEVVSLGSWAEAREMMNKQQADIEAADALRRRVKAAERRRQRHAKAAAAKAAAEAAAAGGGAPGSAGPPSKPAPGSGSGQSAAASGALSAAATPVVVKTEPGGGAADVAMTDSRPASKETTPTSGPMDLGSLLASDPGVVSDSSAGGALWRSSSGVGGGASAASGSQGMPMHVQVKDEHDAEGVAVRAGGGAPASAGSSGLMDDDGESVSEHGEGDTAPPL